MAEFSGFLTCCAMRFFEEVRSLTAEAAFLPRIVAATRLSLRGLTRMVRSTTLASLSASRRGADGLLIALIPRDLLVTRMRGEGAGRRELAEFVSDHLLGDV